MIRKCQRTRGGQHVGLVASLAMLIATVAAADERLMTIERGTLPIIISAPHGGRSEIEGVAPRQGNGIEKFVTTRDERTAELAKAIAADLERRLHGRPHLVVAQWDRKYLDVNRPSKDAFESPRAEPYYRRYHDALRQATDRVTKTYGHGLLVDVHGQGVERSTIFRGSNDGKSVKHLLGRFGREAFDGPHSVFGYLESHGYRVFPQGGTKDDEDRRFNGGHIVRTHGSGAGGTIDALQMEFGGQLRSRDDLNRTAADVAEALAHFAAKYLPKVRQPEPAGR